MRSYSIADRRRTTINHAFASARAPVEPYDPARVEVAMRFLGQEDLNNLLCVYCGDEAQTWDHLHGLVRDKEPSGYGHTLSNLVPSCKDCNSKKGNRPWDEWLRKTGREDRILLLTRYERRFRLVPADKGDFLGEEEKTKLERLKREIITRMEQADDLIRRGRSRALEDASRSRSARAVTKRVR